ARVGAAAGDVGHAATAGCRVGRGGGAATTAPARGRLRLGRGRFHRAAVRLAERGHLLVDLGDRGAVDAAHGPARGLLLLLALLHVADGVVGAARNEGDLQARGPAVEP